MHDSMSRTVRDVHNRQSGLQAYRAERLLRKGFPELRSKVLAIVRSRLRANGLTLDRADLEACYAQAWHGLYSTILAGETVETPEGWLVLVTFRRAVDELRSASRAELGGEDDAGAPGGEIERAGVRAAGSATVAGGAASEPDVAAALDDRVRLRSLFEAIRSRLSVRECEAVSLCYLQGLSRAQAAARMEISERRMQKLMEGSGGASNGVAGKFGELLAVIQAGEWCERQSSLMRAYAFGILDPDGERHALAIAHTRECPACRAQVAALRGLASVLPPPIAFALAGTQVGGAGAGARRASGRGGQAAVRSARRWGGQAARSVSRARGLLGAGASLPLKLAVIGALLIGAGSAYLAARPAPPPAHGQAVTVAAPRPARGSSAALLSRRQPRKRAATRARVARPPVTKNRKSANHAVAAGGSSASEFSPERARGEALAQAASAPRASSGAAGEFGIE
jgi:DNA-directed RNA polymerase specialized sigma24 family protein